MTEILSNLFSKSRQSSTTSSSAPTTTNDGDAGQLVTDAAPLDDVYEAQLKDDQAKEVDVFVDDETSTVAIATPNDEKQMGGVRNEDGALSPISGQGSRFLDVEPFQMPGLDVIRDPGLGSTAALQPRSVNNTQGYNVFQFSQISGLHIGSVYNIKNEAPVTAASSEMRPNRADEPFRRTRTIEG